MLEASNEGRDPFLLLKEGMGSLLLLWCRLDAALSSALHVGLGLSRGKLAGSFHDRLVAMRAAVEVRLEAGTPNAGEMINLLATLDDIRRQRNLIVHSLGGFCADGRRGEPHLICYQYEGNRRISVQISQTELTTLLQNMDRCSRQLEVMDTRESTPTKRPQLPSPQAIGNAQPH